MSGGLLREPLNTLGNLAFVAAGLAMFAVLAQDTARGVTRRNPFMGNQTLAPALRLSGGVPRSGFDVDARQPPFIGAWLDNLSMVIYIVIPWLYNLAVLGRWSTRTFVYTYVSIVGVYAVGTSPSPRTWASTWTCSRPRSRSGSSLSLWCDSAPRRRWLSGLHRLCRRAGVRDSAVDHSWSSREGWWVVLFWLPALVTEDQTGIRRTYTPWFWAGMVSPVSRLCDMDHRKSQE